MDIVSGKSLNVHHAPHRLDEADELDSPPGARLRITNRLGEELKPGCRFKLRRDDAIDRSSNGSRQIRFGMR